MIMLQRPYPQELFYSWMARHFIRTGYARYRFVAEDLYVNPCTKPNPEFLNKLTKEAIDAISRYMSLEDVILNHTMFPQNARFLPRERKEKAYDLLLKMDKEYNNALYIKRGHGMGTRWLRYCPMCAREQRATTGETYWNREHQLIGVDICTKHNCRLVNSNVEISSKTSPSLICAELEVPYDTDANFEVTEMESKIAKYVVDVFNSPINFQSSSQVGQYLHSALEYTKYVTERGLKRRMIEIYEDFIEYYKGLPNNPITEQWHLENVFLNRNMNMYDVCLVALFLGVSVQELIAAKLPERSQREVFDEKMLDMKKRGMTNAEIADALRAPLEAVRSAANSYNIKNGPKRVSVWDALTPKHMQEVKERLENIKMDTESRPVRITKGLIARLLGVPANNAYTCDTYIKELIPYCESVEEFWTRKIIWAFKYFEEDGIPPYWTTVRKNTGLSKEEVERCLPYLKKRLCNSEYEKIVSRVFPEKRYGEAKEYLVARDFIIANSKHFNGQMCVYELMDVLGISYSQYYRFKNKIEKELQDTS